MLEHRVALSGAADGADDVEREIDQPQLARRRGRERRQALCLLRRRLCVAEALQGALERLLARGWWRWFLGNEQLSNEQTAAFSQPWRNGISGKHGISRASPRGALPSRRRRSPAKAAAGALQNDQLRRTGGPRASCGRTNG